MGRPDTSAGRMVAVPKRYGLSVVLVLSALLVTLLVRPEALVGPVFLLAVILSAWLGGMGMGLSISRSILEAHGGRLWATAKDGPGTIFHFTLPKYPEEGPHA